ncbi:phosphatidylethanolamine-binding protein [Paraphoma chrysanthemicola]|nr:phosphatidylethanolamine-binding protein [Paraphoma chrysanthemicola]
MASNSLLTSLKSANLLPSKIIPDNFTPSVNLAVNFSAISPSEGSFVRVSQAKEAPTISISSPSSAPSAQSFTFMLIDPDAPTPDDPKFSYWRHWVVTSISSSNLDASNILASGKTLTQYLAPGPKDESGPHRYLFLLFKEPEGLSLEKTDVGGEEFVDRRSFGAKEFVEKWGLELVGVQWMRGVGDGWKGDEKSEL